MQAQFNDFDKYFNYDLILLKKAKKVIKLISKNEKIKHKYIVEITIVNSEQIKFLNKKYRNIDKDTDVLSFGSKSNFNNGYLLGEVFINYNKVLDQSKNFNHSLCREFLFLLSHGIFHLLDYDHQNSIDEKIMLNKQFKILNRINLL